MGLDVAQDIAVSRGVEVREIETCISPYVVVETWNLDDNHGLVINREDDEAPSRAFSFDSNGFCELTAWTDVRVRDCTPGSDSEDVLLLIERRTEPPTFAVVRANRNSLSQFGVVLDLGETAASSLTLWHGDLYVGTDDRMILRVTGF